MAVWKKKKKKCDKVRVLIQKLAPLSEAPLGSTVAATVSFRVAPVKILKAPWSGRQTQLADERRETN